MVIINDRSLNPIEKFKVAMLHLNRACNHWPVKDVIYSKMWASTAGSIKHKYEFHVKESLFGRHSEVQKCAAACLHKVESYMCENLARKEKVSL